MEEDRFKQNNVLFIISMICLVASLSLFTIAFYITPFLFWGWIYNVPEFIFVWREFLIDNHAYTSSQANLLIFLAYFIPAIITGLITYYGSNKIENQIHHINEPEQPEINRESINDTFKFASKLILAIICAIVAVFFVQWLISTPEVQ